MLFFLKNQSIPPHFQCVHILENGERCKNTPIKGKNKCWQHDGVKRTGDEIADEEERISQNNYARNLGTSLFYDEEMEMERRLNSEMQKKFTEDTLDWYLNWFNLKKDGDKKEKILRLRSAFKAFDWKKYIEAMDLNELKHIGIKIFKLDFPNTSNKDSMRKRIATYLYDFYRGASETYDIRNYNNAKRAEIAKIMKGNNNNNANKKKSPPKKSSKKASVPKKK